MFGLGYGFGGYHYEAQSLPEDGRMRQLRFDVRTSGPFLDLGGAGGLYVSRTTALAGEIGGQLHALRDHGDLGDTSLEILVLMRAGILAEVHVGRHESLQAGGGWAVARIFYSKNDSGAYDNVVEPESMGGPIGSVGFTYTASTIGMLARGYVGRVSNDDSSLVMLGVTGNLSFAF
jgi:hypothetical protein